MNSLEDFTNNGHSLIDWLTAYFSNIEDLSGYTERTQVCKLQKCKPEVISGILGDKLVIFYKPIYHRYKPKSI